MSRLRKKICPDVYSSIHETIHPQKFLLVPSWMAKHTKIPAGITKPHTSDETGSSISLKEYGNSCLYLWRRTLSFKSHPCDNKVLKPSLFSILLLPLTATRSHISIKIPANHPYLHGWLWEGLGCNKWPIKIKESATLPGAERQKTLLDPSRNCEYIVYYKPVLQTDTTEKKERRLYGNSNRENSEQMLGFRGMQAYQTNSRCWMDYNILCLSCNKAERHWT